MPDCYSCGGRISFKKQPSGKKMPVNRNGTSHFETCPKAKQWSGYSRAEYLGEASNYENGLVYEGSPWVRDRPRFFPVAPDDGEV